MKQTFLGLCLIAFLCISCSKVYLTFSRVDKPTSTNVTKIIIAVDKIDDNRITKKFDNIFIRPPINEMQNYLLRQLNNVSFVSRAIKIEDGQINDSIINSVQQIDLIIKLKCYDFKWNLPKRDEVFAGSFIAGLSGGILGGLSYGEKLTEVEGFSVFEVCRVETGSYLPEPSRNRTSSFPTYGSSASLRGSAFMFETDTDLL